MLILHAYIKIDPKKREEFLTFAKDVMTGSKAEEGCNTYHLYEDTIEPNTFVMVEEWKDAAALEFHFKTEHYQLFKERTAGMFLEAPKLVKYEGAVKS